MEKTCSVSWQKFSSDTLGVWFAGIAASKPNSPANSPMSFRKESFSVGETLELEAAGEAELEGEEFASEELADATVWGRFI